MLIFSPHPDDECITGGLALRLLRETGARVVNIAVTLGSDKTRRQSRLQELKCACEWLGFDLEIASAGLEKINPASRSNDVAHWAGAVKIIADLIVKHQPRAIFLPHEFDGHPTHTGTHLLVMDALKTLPEDFKCHLVETEFWRQMPAPNLIVESSAEDVADLVAALSFHVGEVRRNPYHLRLPAWMQDNVRRGAELVGGHGGAAPDYTFATLYKVLQWKNRSVQEFQECRKRISAQEFPGNIFGWTR
jgi:LmbE family N-acetylglucosaminyl deacetylase